MTKYIIALKELGITDKNINKILHIIPREDLKSLFEENFLDLKFKYNIDIKQEECFFNKEKLDVALQNAETIINNSRKQGIKIVTILSKRYPANLRSINNPPPILYYKGQGFTKRYTKSIGCVGSREISEFGLNAAKLIPNLVNEGFTIISGLAEGIDTLCHQECLKYQGSTVAVLAHGLDTIYPEANKELAQMILDQGGTIVSEYPIGIRADKFRFIQRNRLISGLSQGVLVLECKEKSGTMHTVKFAIEQGRKVFCPQPSINIDTTKGLVHILNNFNGIGIPSTQSYHIIIQELGYKLKNKEKEKIVRANVASNLINKLNINAINIINCEVSNEYCNSSAKVDRQIYMKYKEYLKKNHLTHRDIVNGLILAIVNDFNEEK